MKRSIVTVPPLVVAALSLAAAPASAAQAPDFAAFSSGASSCVPDAEGETCTSINLDASEGSDGAGQVWVSVQTTSVVDGEAVWTSESGWASTRGLSVDRSLGVTLAPTTIPLERCEYDEYDEWLCERSREIVVSADHAPVAGPTVSRTKSSTRDGTCTTTSTLESKHAGIAGSITLDGGTYDGTGNAYTEDTRSSTRCK